MLAHEIPPSQSREADRRSGAAVTTTGAERWPGEGPGTRPAPIAIAAAIVLHAATCWFALSFVRVPAPQSPPEDETVALVFAPPESPAAAVPAPPDATPEQPPVPAAAAEQPSSPPATPEPPAPPEVAAPPPEPRPLVEQPPVPVEPAPLPRPEEKAPAEVPTIREKAVEPPKPSPVPHKPMAHAKPTAPARVAVPPASAPSASAPSASAPSSAPSAPAQPPAEAPIAADWERSLAAWLAAHKTYPELARRRGVEGNVALRFTADRSGRVLTVLVVRGAGSAVLDSAAEALVRGATLPPFPTTMPQDTATVTVTIRYALTK